jgi:hypothetical protein
MMRGTGGDLNNKGKSLASLIIALQWARQLEVALHDDFSLSDDVIDLRLHISQAETDFPGVQVGEGREDLRRAGARPKHLQHVLTRVRISQMHDWPVQGSGATVVRSR